MVKEISLFEFSKRFNTEEVCRQYLEEIRWNSILVCPFCKSLNVCKFSTGKGYGCRDCRRNFSITTGTIFDNSKIPISTWLYVMYWASLSKKNFVSIQISKNVGITQRSAWAMMMKIRTVYEQTYTKKLSGIIEIDECFLSKGIKWRRWGSINTRKLPILGLIERGGKVIVKLILDRHKATIESFILKNVETNSTIYTDGHGSYRNLGYYYKHEWLNHSEREFSRGDVHTNTIEGFWSQLKKAIRSSHHSVSSTYVQMYCDEIAYRYNTREMNAWDRFNDMLKRACVNKTNMKKLVKKRVVKA